MKKLNVEKWNKMRLALEGTGASYTNDAPLFAAVGIAVFDSRTRGLLKAIVSAKTADTEQGRRRAESHIELYRGYAAGKYNVKPEDQQAYAAVLADWDAGRLDPSDLANVFAQQDVICKEALYLTQPKRGVFHASEFKGGTVDLITWLYVLRAQCRENPRLHLKGKTIEQQEQLVQKALDKAPKLLGALLEE
jgi:hypothetical protein